MALTRIKSENIETSSDLNIDSGTLYVDVTNNRIGIGTPSPSTKLEIEGSASLNPDYAVYMVNAYYDSAWKYKGNGASWGIGNNFGGPTNGVCIAQAAVNASGAGAALTWLPRLNIDSAGNVGIGTSSPGYKLEVTGQQRFGDIWFNTNEINSAVDSGNLYIGYQKTQNLYFRTGGTTGAGTERMRIDSAGDVFIGTTTSGVFDGIGVSYDVSLGKFFINSGTNGDYAGLTINNTYNDNNARKMIDFYHREVYIGDITTSSTVVAYNTTSDYRLKENVVDLSNATDRIKLLQPRRFNFIVDPDKTIDGFIAHEVSDVVPEAITGEKDGVDENGNPKYQGIDASKLVPLLTAALQEAISKIESLESRISVLEGS